MTLSAHQPAYIPWIGYFNKIVSTDQFIIMDDVQFEKNSFINRNQIQTNQGNNIWLTIPVQTKDYKNKSIRDIEIDNKTQWRKKHWESIYQNYKKFPYFKLYENEIRKIYDNDWNYLIDILNYQLNTILSILDIKTNLIYLSDLNIKSKKQELIRDMCIKTNSHSFYFGANGINYAELDFFNKENISILFQNTNKDVNKLSILHYIFTQDMNDIKNQIYENFNFSSTSR